MNRSRCALLLAGLAVPGLFAASPAAAQWWWPPGMGVDPTCPHPTSTIEVTLSGNWPDSCPPNTADVNRVGLDIDIDIRREPPPGFCLTVITPWELPVEIGQLPAGTYNIYTTYFLQGSPATSRELIGTVQVDPACPGPCYANCDGSTTEPILTVDDFTCFINEFAAAQGLPHEQQVMHYANCDGSTTAPVLTVDDFTCFINEFAAGCP